MLLPHPVFLTALTQTATAPETADAARKATLMFTLVALALGALLLLVVLMVVVRRTRDRQGRAVKPTGMLIDPWSESARRVQPFDSQDRPD